MIRVLQPQKDGQLQIKNILIMWFKCLDEIGEYISLEDGTPKNLLVSEISAYTPEGVNVGWKSFSTIGEAWIFFKIIPKPIEEDIT